MIPFPVAFRIPSPQTVIYGIAALTVVAMIWVGVDFVGSKKAAEAEVMRLADQLRERDSAIKVLRETADQLQQAEVAAENARNELIILRDSYEAIQEAIAVSSETSDADVAPVLRDTLDQLNRVRDAGTNNANPSGSNIGPR